MGATRSWSGDVPTRAGAVLELARSLIDIPCRLFCPRQGWLLGFSVPFPIPLKFRTAGGDVAAGDAPRPRPRPGIASVTDSGRAGSGDRFGERTSTTRRRRSTTQSKPALPAVRQPQQLATTAGGAVVSAARVGRLLGRTGWRLARQLPGVSNVEAQVQRVGSSLVGEFARLLNESGTRAGFGNPDEERALLLLQNGASDPEPLRSAMTELLDRSGRQDRARGDEYLFGSIISQLVPDEARILSALIGGREFAAIDVVAKPGRGASVVQLGNVSTIGRAAKVAQPANTGHYVARLHALGLIDFADPSDELASQFDVLRDDPAVQRAKADADGKVRLTRKRIVLSEFGGKFWAACSPRPSVGPRRD